MLVYNEKVLECGFTSTGAVHTPVDTYRLLASADKWIVQARVSQVSGASPTLTVSIDQSADGSTWIAVQTVIAAAALSTTGVTNIMASYAGAVSTGRLIQLRSWLGGTTPSAFVELWVAGRAKRPSGRGVVDPLQPGLLVR